ncbi:MAG: NADPH-dependent 7-cyano-7-deazaguanine reductase QueF [Pseudomonadota bacterium]
MADDQPPKMLLGGETPRVETYSPGLLFPIPRGEARSQFDAAQLDRLHGVDLWHAYELSWLNLQGKPECRVGRFQIPAHSPQMVESKSFKLYLNSLNATVFKDEAEFGDFVIRDLEKVVGGSVALQLLAPDDLRLAGVTLTGTCIDELSIDGVASSPQSDLLWCGSRVVEETLYSHLMRSLCPVTGQPDWASVRVQYEGLQIDHGSLLNYLLSFRQHGEYHEHCVERMFFDILDACAPDALTVQAFYTRRGGLDINPVRSTLETVVPQPRLNRQ